MLMRWREVTFPDAVRHCDGRRIAQPAYDGAGGWPADSSMPSGVVFDDGTALACCSEWSGPYSEVTPDIDADPPRFWVGEPDG